MHELCSFGRDKNRSGSVRALFDFLGISDKIEWVQVPEAYRLITYEEADPLDVTMPFGVDEYIEAMEKYVPGSRGDITAVFELAAEYLKATAEMGTAKSSADAIKKLLKHRDFLHTCSMSANGVLPYFRAGQYINMLCGENIYPFFLSGAPSDALNGTYEISVEKENAAHGFFSALSEEDSLVSGAPMGYFYHQPLRDGVTSAVITDLTGKGAALSMQTNENTEVFFCEKPEDIPVAQSVKADTVFICGKKEFCEKAKAAFTGRHMRVLFTDPPIVRTERGKFTCTVCCGDDTFSFDCFSDEPLMTALEKNGVRLFNKCRTGDCAFCRAKLISGTVSHAFDGEDDARRKADVKFGYIHPCRAFPESDVTLKY